MASDDDDPGKPPELRIPAVTFPDISRLVPKMPEPYRFTMPPIPRNPLVELAEDSYASEFHKRLISWIMDFDASLDGAHEVGVRLVNFGQSVTFHLDDIGYWNPALISFRGRTETGDPVELIQHVSQISVLLLKLPRDNPNEPKQPIGFREDGE